MAEPFLPPGPEGVVEGIGTYFEVANSRYLNVTLASSEPIQLSLESGTSTIMMHVEAAEGATSTQITLDGLEPATTYYKYTDSYQNLEELVTDENGTCAYNQDLNAPHLVLVQPTASTIYLTTSGWSQPVGTWDPATLTGTLTQDVSESIEISGNDITLDGAGFTVSGLDSGSGIRAYSSHNVTISDVNVQGFYIGINAYRSDNPMITDVNVQGSSVGIYVSSSSGGLLTNSTVSTAQSRGIGIFRGSDHTISGNTVSDSLYGIYLDDTSSNTVSGNTVSASASTRSSVSVVYSTSNIIADNILGGGTSQTVFVRDSTGTSLTGNTISNSSGADAIYIVRASHNSTLRANEVLNAPVVVTGYSAPVDGCTAEDNHFRGSTLSIQIAQNCNVTNNTLENSSLVLDRVRDSIVADNTQWDTWWNEGHGIYVSGYATGTVLLRNAASDNPAAGIFLSGVPGYMQLSDNMAERNGTDGIIVSGNNNTLTGNLVADNGGNGLYLVGGERTTATNTTALNNFWGIYLTGGRYHTISGSTVSGNLVGIYLRYFALYNTVRDNRVMDNDYGVLFYYQADDNKVYNNTVCRSRLYGLNLSGYSDGNSIYNNDFLGNRTQAYAYYNRGVNYLSKYKPTGGNYWSHLRPPSYVDNDGDGFYDQAYVVPVSSGEMIDRYPLVSPLFEPCDNEGPITSDVTVNPSVVEVNGSVLLTAIVDDRDTGGSDIALVEYRLDESPWTSLGGPYPSSAVGVGLNLYAPSTAGVYEVCVRGTDTVGNVGEQECTFLVAYDPSGGFVTGGGWIDSEAGAYVPDPSLAGKANFGFVSKYKKGAMFPTGNTEFQFKVADLNFKSSSYDWLVIAGDNARYKGIGTINGEGSYKFMLWGGDGNGTDGADTFRIRIWTEDEVTAVETDVYDNGFGQDLGGGSVVIHKAK